MTDASSFEEYAEVMRMRLRYLEPAIEQAMAIVGQDMVATAKEQLMSGKLKYPTGNLARSLNSRIEVSGDEVTAVMGTNAEYAPYVEYGTGSKGDFEALGASSFTTKESWTYTPDGGETFRTGHPVAPRPYLRPALKAAQYGGLEKRIDEMLRKVFE